MSSDMAYGELGATLHSIEDMAWLRAIANMTVIVPADPVETAQAVEVAVSTAVPVVLPLRRPPPPFVHYPPQPLPLGKGPPPLEGRGIPPLSQHGLGGPAL